MCDINCIDDEWNIFFFSSISAKIKTMKRNKAMHSNELSNDVFKPNAHITNLI